MTLCKYGCGKEGKFKNHDGSYRCEKSWNSCPSLRSKNSKTNKGRIFNKRHKDNLSKSLKGKATWNKGLTKETDDRVADYGRKASKKLKGRKPWNKGVSKYVESENNPNWKGGSKGYFHKEAWKRFGKMYCEICNMNINEHFNLYNQRFAMHNKLNPKDYSILESSAWICVCKRCHTIIEEDQKRLKGVLDYLLNFGD